MEYPEIQNPAVRDVSYLITESTWRSMSFTSAALKETALGRAEMLSLIAPRASARSNLLTGTPSKIVIGYAIRFGRGDSIINLVPDRAICIPFARDTYLSEYCSPEAAGSELSVPLRHLPRHASEKVLLVGPF